MTDVRRKPEVDYYKVLQVDPTAEMEVIEAAYRALSKKYHPDINRATDAETKMSQINAAYNVLSDIEKRRDYNLIRDSLNRFNNIPEPAAADAGANRAAKMSPGRPSYRPKTSPPRPTPANEPETTPKPNRPRPSHYTYEPEESDRRPGSTWLWIVGGILVLLVVIVGGLALTETVLGNPFGTSVFTSKPNNTPTASNPQVVTTTAPSGQQTIPTTAPTTGLLSRTGALAFLQQPSVFDGRVVDLSVSGPEGSTRSDTIKVSIKMSERGVTTNSVTPLPVTKGDALETLRLAEGTAYALVYSLFRQYPDLNRLQLSLTDPKNDQKVIYRADMTRAAAYSFYAWRTDMSSLSKSTGDVLTAASEDRLALHYGVSPDDGTYLRLNSPDQQTLLGEINAWVPDGVTVTIEPSGSISVGYLLNNNEQQWKGDWAKIFYALYTRFPNLDVVKITRGVPGNGGEVRVSNRALFNQVTVGEWASYTFGRNQSPKSLIDSLPNQTAFSLPQPQQITVATGSTGNGKNWQFTQTGAALVQSKVGGLTTSKGQFLLVPIKIINVGNSREWPNPSQLFSLVDKTGTIYRPSLTAAALYYLVDRNQPPFAPLEPNASNTILLAFDLPAVNPADLRLQLTDDTLTVIMPLS